MQIHGVTSISIIVSREAIPNSAVSQGAARAEQVRAYADPRPLSSDEAVRLAMLSPSKAYRERLPRPSRLPDQTGIALDIRA